MSRKNLAFACATIAGVILLFAAGILQPHVVVEDNLVESSGAVLFAVACLLALDTALRKRASMSSNEKKMLVGTSGLCLLLFLSEISFGARLFDLQMPKMHGGGEFDGGHDVVILSFRLLREGGSTGILVLLIAALALLIPGSVLLYLFRHKLLALLDQIRFGAFEFRLALAVALLASAVALDLLDSYKASILEEVLEFVASGVLVFAVLALPRKNRRGDSLITTPSQPDWTNSRLAKNRQFKRALSDKLDLTPLAVHEPQSVGAKAIARRTGE
jgi:hypothetical protein